MTFGRDSNDDREWSNNSIAALVRVLTPLYVKTVVQAAKSAAWRAR